LEGGEPRAYDPCCASRVGAWRMPMDETVDPKLAEARGRVGSVVGGKWQLDQVIGVGGMAAVYAATHRNGHRVAIKVLHRLLSSDPEIRRRFLREGYAANKVEHPGTVKVHDDGFVEDGSVFLVMELLNGESLDARAERLGGGLDLPELLTVADQLLDVLAAAHDAGVVHRDIKPENVLMTTEGTIRVLDFGIARLREQTPGATSTWAGVMMGTPAFMAPEQARGAWDEVDAQTDLWAVGATMFTLLSGRLVHEAVTTQEMLVAAMVKPARSLKTVAPNRSPAVIAVIDRALAFDKKERWPDARAMQQAVRTAHEIALGRPMLTASMVRANETASPARVDARAPTVRARSAPHPDASTVAPVSRTQGHAGGRRAARLGLYAGALVVAVVGAGLVARSQLSSRAAGGTEPLVDDRGAPTAPTAPRPSADASLLEPSSGTTPTATDGPGPSLETSASAGSESRPSNSGELAPTIPPWPGARLAASARSSAGTGSGGGPAPATTSMPILPVAGTAAPSATVRVTDPETLKDRRK
jgi:serine/threonine protein kinase